MKKVKIFVLIVMVVSLSCCFFFSGCTGGGIYDPTPDPTETESPGPGPTSAPVVRFTTGKTLIRFAQGQSNIFNLALWGNSQFYPQVLVEVVNSVQYFVGETLYWVQTSSNPLGRVYTKNNKYSVTSAQPISTPITGLNLPKALLVERNVTNAADPRNNVDFIYTAETGTQVGSNLLKYRRDARTGTTSLVTRMINDRPGTINYAVFDYPEAPTFIYYAFDTGGFNSGIERVSTNITSVMTPQVLANNLNQAHSLYVFNHETLNNEGNLVYKDFLFVTEMVAGTGRVLMYNITNWNGTTSITPVVIATGQRSPAKMTFIPDIENYQFEEVSVFGHSNKPAGYLYWTNYDALEGQLVRARLESNLQGTDMRVVGTPQVVASSLRFPYDIIGPDDFRYVFLNGEVQGNAINVTGMASLGMKYSTWNHYNTSNNNTFKTLYISSNRTQADGGNWYAVDTGRFTGTTLTPASTAVSDYLSSTVDFPLNGKMQVLMLTDPVTAIGRVFKKDLYFTIYNFAGLVTNESGIYHSREVIIP
jgi:hypothetical protein